MSDVRVKAYGLAALIFALDRLTKWLVETHVSAMDTVSVIPGFFAIVNSQNRGVAFGIFNDSDSPVRTIFLILLAGAAVVFIAAMLWRPSKLDRRSFWALAIILGGAAGNVYDRIVAGRVTDFLDLYFRDYHWHTFNVADMAVVVGSGLLILDMLKPKRKEAHVS